MRKKSITWNLEMRRVLADFLHQGYNQSKILEHWKNLDEEFSNVTSYSLNAEVRQGLTEEEYEQKRYVKYDILRSYQNMLGTDAIKYILERKEPLDDE